VSALSDYLEQKLLDLVFNQQALTPPATYVALFTTAPADDGTGGVEVSGGAYARQQVFESGNASTPRWNAAVADGAGFLVDNEHDINYPQATADWGTVVAFGIYDAVTGGNLLFHGALTANQTVNNGSIFKFAAGDLNLRLE
jgi:hypothetical protein